MWGTEELRIPPLAFSARNKRQSVLADICAYTARVTAEKMPNSKQLAALSVIYKIENDTKDDTPNANGKLPHDIRFGNWGRMKKRAKRKMAALPLLFPEG